MRFIESILFNGRYEITKITKNYFCDIHNFNAYLKKKPVFNLEKLMKIVCENIGKHRSNEN